jgi:hypothetical protein
VGLLQDPNVTKFSQNKNNFLKKLLIFFSAFKQGTCNKIFPLLKKNLVENSPKIRHQKKLL